MKKTMKRIAAALVSLLLLLGLTTSSFATNVAPAKEETVYALLGGDGSVSSMYAVNTFNMLQAGKIIDYGDYSSLRNMTTTDSIGYDNGTATINAPIGKFYYQGNMVSKQTPWDIGISYKLDGKAISPESLAGQSGALNMTISIKQNKAVRAEYFEHFTLQISLSLDTKLCDNIVAGGATFANAGSMKTIAFTHLTNTEKSYTISADVHDFEMDPIQFNGLLVTMEIQIDGLSDLTGGFADFTSGISKLNEGAVGLKTGSAQFNTGLQTLDAGSKKLSDSSSQISQALTQSSTGLSDLLKSTAQLKALATALSASSDPQVQALAQGYLAQVTALEKLSAGLTAVSGQYTTFDAGLSQYTAGVTALSGSYVQVNGGVGELAAGVETLKKGTATLSSDVDRKITDILSAYSAKGYHPASFVSEKNAMVSSVQFVIRTNAISIPEADSEAPQDEAALTFWQRILKLFGLD